MRLLKASDLISSQIEHINRICWLLFMGKVFVVFLSFVKPSLL